MKKLLGLKEFAERAGLSYNGVRRMALAGEIPCIRVGNRYKFAEDALEKAAIAQTEIRKEKAAIHKERERIFMSAKKQRRNKTFDFETFRKKTMQDLKARVMGG